MISSEQKIPEDPNAIKRRNLSVDAFCEVRKRYHSIFLVCDAGQELPTSSIRWPRIGEPLGLEAIKARRGPSRQWSIPNDPSEFLKMQPELLTVIHEAEKKLKDAFGEGTQVKRELHFSDDEERSYPTLFLIAQVEHPVVEAREIMKSIDENWWLDQLERVQGKVQLDFEFR